MDNLLRIVVKLEKAQFSFEIGEEVEKLEARGFVFFRKEQRGSSSHGNNSNTIYHLKSTSRIEDLNSELKYLKGRRDGDIYEIELTFEGDEDMKHKRTKILSKSEDTELSDFSSDSSIFAGGMQIG